MELKLRPRLYYTNCCLIALICCTAWPSIHLWAGLGPTTSVTVNLISVIPKVEADIGWWDDHTTRLNVSLISIVESRWVQIQIQLQLQWSWEIGRWNRIEQCVNLLTCVCDSLWIGSLDWISVYSGAVNVSVICPISIAILEKGRRDWNSTRLNEMGDGWGKPIINLFWQIIYFKILNLIHS